MIREFAAEERKKNRCKQSVILGFADILHLLEGPGRGGIKARDEGCRSISDVSTTVLHGPLALSFSVKGLN